MFRTEVSEYANSPANFDGDRLGKLKVMGQKLLGEVLSFAAVIIATPVALGQAATRLNFDTDLVIVDEAARMSEAQALISKAHFDNAVHIFLGDPRQFCPVSQLAASQHPNVWSRQRQRSILHRAVQNGQVDGNLRLSYRCRGRIAEWAANSVYGSSMEIVHQQDELTEAMRTFLGGLTSPSAESPITFRANCAWLAFSGSSDQSFGTSFGNTMQARFVVQVAKQAFLEGPVIDVNKWEPGQPLDQAQMGTVLILCGYAQQKALYERLVEEIPPSQIPPGRLSVRTIDDSQSHQATVVILDLVRTGKCGFLDDQARLVVATTRAQGH
ncbi:hypothetical protein CDD80_1369 [Ophiocordyceps camponoti-rufipedis]|uniref:Uncharacterized protein n=1 Tax=Ophiocordyceps camponoti-rufipedis TaxID=2004952 RepID=A0A2C5Y0Q1_9HYPO|nr:hypothetical protein CDD80_1369 [Ophiocordyceps camponoti-rufipedis]